ncbi:MAG TPA: hypothetical protein VHF26_05480 [Trebonia sp.]|nr:hypothetical protein [Trebonia sp.]
MPSRPRPPFTPVLTALPAAGIPLGDILADSGPRPLGAPAPGRRRGTPVPSGGNPQP